MAGVNERIEAFLGGGPFGVAGASTNRAKYGNKVFRCYLQNGRIAYPVNPTETQVEGRRAFATLTDLQRSVGAIHGLSIITPPPITERIIEEAGSLGIRHVWMQPGAESVKAISRAESLGMNVIANGACLLVVLGYSERASVD